MASMSTPEPKPPAAGDTQADALAAELMNLGSFGDAGNPPPADAPAAPRLSPDADPTSVAVAAAPGPCRTRRTAQKRHVRRRDRRPPAKRPRRRAARPGPLDGQRRARQRPDARDVGLDLPAFQQALSDAQASSIDLLRDVDLNVKIELGRSRMMVEDVLKLSEGASSSSTKLAGDPVDVFVNDKLVARGEVLVLNDNFCVRINEIVATAKEEA
jgi:flagellar motor switch protein FliN/FliY